MDKETNSVTKAVTEILSVTLYFYIVSCDSIYFFT